MLGGLPLALEQAAAYIQATRGTLAELPGLVPAPAGRAAGPWRAHWIQQDGGQHLGAGVGPPAADRAGRGRSAAAAGVLRARGDPAAPTAATPHPGRARGNPAAPTAATGPPGCRKALARCVARTGAAARASSAANKPTGRGRSHRGAAPVFAGNPGCGRVGVGAPAGTGRHRRPDARGDAGGMAGGRCCPDEAAIPADTSVLEAWSACAALLPHASAALTMTATAWTDRCLPRP